VSELKEIIYDGFKALNLSNSFTSVIVVPSLGGKIVSIEKRSSGFDYAFKNEHIKNKKCLYGSDYAASSASGVDECFPTVAASRYTEFPWEDIAIPDHGEIWAQEVEIEIVGKTIIQKAYGIRFPYVFRRAINLEDNTVSINYRVENPGTMDFNYIWSIHPHFNLYENTEIIIEGNPDVYMDFSMKNAFKMKTHKYKWPVLTTDNGKMINFSKIEDVDNGDGEKFYLCNMSRGEVKLRYPDKDETMIFKFNKDILKYCGIWIDRNCWPFNTEPYKVLAIEPCNCISDRFEDSLQRKAYNTIKAKNYAEWKLELILE